ncbi:paraquat-inducible protein A [Aliarcobacter cryaerophilus]|uniref:Paraquat-inducible protein A n=1 Tax=Aliarcobacter cryaerophilus TaxID=28198 RepID=A0A2S9SRW4_9BACT|nr:paraquat-inducible protein A [Aliarcobacter cryaerophilus]MCT7530215.1 paraquat-inducible protein A [Aliarcobacter cryaerophilus]PRM89269.1 paraquat-inducible protein A [Aliarcobacter cryaerophilus]QNM89715.1 paraquat-inducible protein A [Aliarcobacter cryaerophilus]
MILISCSHCHKVYEKDDYSDFTCSKCNHKVTKRVKNSLQISLALTICAMFLYIPSMIYPMMVITQFGVNLESTIIEGIIQFLEHGSYFVAIVILVASVAIPMIKLAGLFFIFLSLRVNVKMNNKTKVLIYKYIEAIGKWSMIDIYVVALLASIVQLDEIFSIKGGVAATSFALMVICTIIAANKFDTRIIWDE